METIPVSKNLSLHCKPNPYKLNGISCREGYNSSHPPTCKQNHFLYETLIIFVKFPPKEVKGREILHIHGSYNRRMWEHSDDIHRISSPQISKAILFADNDKIFNK
jgi:hypothetical protein